MAGISRMPAPGTLAVWVAVGQIFWSKSPKRGKPIAPAKI